MFSFWHCNRRDRGAAFLHRASRGWYGRVALLDVLMYAPRNRRGA